MIEPLVAVELFGIEEMKPELLAAGATARADGAARSSVVAFRVKWPTGPKRYVTKCNLA